MRASKTVPDKLTAVVGNSRFRSKKNTTLKRPLVFDRLHTHLFTNSVLIVIFTIIHSLLVSPTLSVLKGFEQKNVTCYEMWYLVLVINSSVFQIFQSNPENIYNTCSQLDHSCHWSTSTIFLVVTLHKSFKTVTLKFPNSHRMYSAGQEMHISGLLPLKLLRVAFCILILLGENVRIEWVWYNIIGGVRLNNWEKSLTELQVLCIDMWTQIDACTQEFSDLCSANHINSRMRAIHCPKYWWLLEKDRHENSLSLLRTNPWKVSKPILHNII